MLSQTLTVFTTNLRLYSFFFFNDTATTEIYTLSLHDALPISSCRRRNNPVGLEKLREGLFSPVGARPDARSRPKARLRILRGGPFFCGGYPSAPFCRRSSAHRRSCRHRLPGVTNHHPGGALIPRDAPIAPLQPR